MSAASRERLLPIAYSFQFAYPRRMNVDHTVGVKTVQVDTSAPLLVPVEEAARLLGLGRTQTYGLISSKELRSVKVGRRRLVSRRHVEDFVRRLESDGESAA
jgi:excisionase family DNA binding protein